MIINDSEDDDAEESAAADSLETMKRWFLFSDWFSFRPSYFLDAKMLQRRCNC